MKLFITGATGFLGARLAEMAVAQGHEVTALVRPGSSNPRLKRLKACGAHLAQGQLSDAASVLKQSKPDAVCHLAWVGVANRERNNPAQFRDNVVPSADLALAAAEAGCKAFIALGSQAEYGPQSSAIDEGTCPSPTTMYGASKLAAMTLTEQIAALHTMRWAWLRLFSVYGPDDNAGWLIPDLIGKLLRGEEPPLTPGTQKWDYLHITDAAAGVLAVATSEKASGLFNLGSAQPVPVRTIAETIRDLIDPKLTLGFGQVEFRPDQVMHLEADISRLKAATGWQPRIGLREGLRETIDWYRA